MYFRFSDETLYRCISEETLLSMCLREELYCSCLCINVFTLAIAIMRKGTEWNQLQSNAYCMVELQNNTNGKN